MDIVLYVTQSHEPRAELIASVYPWVCHSDNIVFCFAQKMSYK